jgi:DNA polymerase I-like protein with 3'-5' exonuclease and polymerase domains
VVRDNHRISITGNCGGAVDGQYNRILKWGPDYAPKGSPEAAREFTTRSIVRAGPGWYIVSADLEGAEIATAGWSSGDETLIEHARRATLDEADPDWLDLHADLAKAAFRLEGTLAEVKKKYKHLRTASKRARFGHYYGASPDKILRKALEESPDVTIEQVEQIVRGHDELYPALAAYFGAARGRANKPGWLQNGYGGVRRFRAAAERDLQEAQGREAQNWTCQGLVADAVTVMLGNVWYELRRRKLRSVMILSVYDSIMLEVPAAEVDVVVDDLLPLCMVERAPVPVTTLAGEPLARGPYRFGIDVDVYRNWGVAVPEAEWRAAARAARGENPTKSDSRLLSPVLVAH